MATHLFVGCYLTIGMMIAVLCLLLILTFGVADGRRRPTRKDIAMLAVVLLLWPVFIISLLCGVTLAALFS